MQVQSFVQEELTFTHFAEDFVCGTKQKVSCCKPKAAGKQAELTSGSQVLSKLKNIVSLLPLTRKDSERDVRRCLTSSHLQSLASVAADTIARLTLSSALHAGDGLSGTMNAEVSVAAGTPGRSTG